MENESFEYVMNAFHELKSPLTTIMLATEIIKTHNLTNEDKDVYLTMILNEALRMKNKVNNAIKSLKNNYFDVDINQKCDVHDILERVVSMNKIDEIGMYMMASRHVVLGNIGYIESAFRELLENSRKYKSELPLRVSIRTFNRGNKIKITFSDNGIGIEKNFQNDIFEKDFNYKNNKATDNQHNTGLGLYYMKRNIQRINGTITVESKHNRGSLFTITLPLVN